MLTPLISADCHVTEPSDLWARELPPSMRDRGPRMEVREDRACFVVEDHVAYKLPPFAGVTPSQMKSGMGGRI